MKLFSISKDGGPKSHVWALWLAEIKPLFSAALLRFTDKSRDEYHSHAFDSVSWVLSGALTEEHLDGRVQRHEASLAPVVTAKSTFHRVMADGVTWVFTLRGPWAKTWQEYSAAWDEFTTLGHGRKVIS
jgi:hypothetical protein